MKATFKKNFIVMQAATVFALGSGLLVLAGCTPALPLAPTASPTLVPVRESATAAPALLAPTATPTALLSPVPSEASLPIEDPFNDNGNNWHTDPPLITVQDGTYNHTIDCPDSHVSPQCGTFIRMPFTFPMNFRLGLDTTLVSASPGASVLVGFQVRRSDIEYYFISYSLTADSYEISYISQNGQSGIIPETGTGLIETSAGATNTLGIEMMGRLLTPLINGQGIAPAQDGTIRNAGDTYLVILVARGHAAELQFDNLTVKETE